MSRKDKILEKIERAKSVSEINQILSERKFMPTGGGAHEEVMQKVSERIGIITTQEIFEISKEKKQSDNGANKILNQFADELIGLSPDEIKESLMDYESMADGNHNIISKLREMAAESIENPQSDQIFVEEEKEELSTDDYTHQVYLNNIMTKAAHFEYLAKNLVLQPFSDMHDKHSVMNYLYKNLNLFKEDIDSFLDEIADSHLPLDEKNKLSDRLLEIKKIYEIEYKKQSPAIIRKALKDFSSSFDSHVERQRKMYDHTVKKYNPKKDHIFMKNFSLENLKEVVNEEDLELLEKEIRSHESYRQSNLEKKNDLRVKKISGLSPVKNNKQESPVPDQVREQSVETPTESLAETSVIAESKPPMEKAQPEPENLNSQTSVQDIKEADTQEPQNSKEIVLRTLRAEWEKVRASFFKEVNEGNSNVTIHRVIDDVGNSALHIAALVGDMEGVELLIRKGAEVTLVNQNGETALDYAKVGGNNEVIRLLTSRLKNTAEEPNQTGSIPVKTRKLFHAERLLKKFNIEISDLDKKTEVGKIKEISDKYKKEIMGSITDDSSILRAQNAIQEIDQVTIKTIEPQEKEQVVIEIGLEQKPEPRIEVSVATPAQSEIEKVSGEKITLAPEAQLSVTSSPEKIQSETPILSQAPTTGVPTPRHEDNIGNMAPKKNLDPKVEAKAEQVASAPVKTKRLFHAEYLLEKFNKEISGLDKKTEVGKIREIGDKYIEKIMEKIADDSGKLRAQHAIQEIDKIIITRSGISEKFQANLKASKTISDIEIARDSAKVAIYNNLVGANGDLSKEDKKFEKIIDIFADKKILSIVKTSLENELNNVNSVSAVINLAKNAKRSLPLYMTKGNVEINEIANKKINDILQDKFHSFRMKLDNCLTENSVKELFYKTQEEINLEIDKATGGIANYSKGIESFMTQASNLVWKKVGDIQQMSTTQRRYANNSVSFTYASGANKKDIDLNAPASGFSAMIATQGK